MNHSEFKSRIDKIWDVFWSGGIANPMNVIEQFTYLLFLRQLDKQQDSLDTQRAFGKEVPASADIFQPNQQDFRWKNLVTETSPTRLKELVDDHAFPHMRNLGRSGMAAHMKNANFGIDNPNTLRTVISQIDELPLTKQDLLGDLYEYMLSKLSSSGTNGQFRTTQHVIDLMVELMRPVPNERIIDPACGTAGFLVNAWEWMQHNHEEALLKTSTREKFQKVGLTGYDNDATMVRLSAMNLFMHGFQEPNIKYKDSLGPIDPQDEDAFDIVLANPPFSGTIDAAGMDKKLNRLATTKKTELLFINRFLSLLKIGGRAAVIVPEGVLFGSTKAHKAIRKELIENQKLDAVIKLPSGAFKPYTGVSTAILCFTRTDAPDTDHVWFYEVRADGCSLDDKRTPLLDEHLLGPRPLDRLPDPDNPLDKPQTVNLTAEQHDKNNLPDVVKRFALRDASELDRGRTEQSFCVPVSEIVDNDYDLSMNRYKEIVFEDVETREPMEIIAEIEALDAQIATGMAQLKKLIGGAGND